MKPPSHSPATSAQFSPPPPRTECVKWSVAEAAGIEFHVRRLDDIPGPAPGNKAWKLQYHVERAMRMHEPAILTFGGAWSNHLHATAATGRAMGIRTIGVVRAEAHELEDLTLTLQDCKNWGMELVPVSRAEYREKHLPFFKAWLRDQFGNPWIVPEGAGDALGTMGCQSLITPQDLKNPWDAILVSAGTGATAAGMAIGLRGRSHLFVCSALKGVDMGKSVQQCLENVLLDEPWASEIMENLTAWNDAHQGGFGKVNAPVQNFMQQFEAETGIELDSVYTAKSLIKLQSVLSLPSVQRPLSLRSKSRVFFVHTGGIQGNRFKGFSKDKNDS
jgi:1-aminocyclopropane-1-carboxylate deaminase